MTFIYESEPYLWTYTACENEFPTSPLSKVIVWQTYIQTDRQTDRQTDMTKTTTYATSWVVIIATSKQLISYTVNIGNYEVHGLLLPTFTESWFCNAWPCRFIRQRPWPVQRQFSTDHVWQWSSKHGWWIAGSFTTVCLTIKTDKKSSLQL